MARAHRGGRDRCGSGRRSVRLGLPEKGGSPRGSAPHRPGPTSDGGQQQGAGLLPCSQGGPRGSTRSPGRPRGGEGLWPGALWPERGAVQSPAPPPPRQAPATSGPAGTPRLPEACGVGAEVTTAGSGSASEPRGSDPPRPPCSPRPRGTRVFCENREPREGLRL